MAIIVERVSLDDVKKAPYTVLVYYSVNTCWWTHDINHLCLQPGTQLPCDPRGGMLCEAPIDDFIAQAEANPSHYGKHGLRAFMAAHHENCQVAWNDPRRTCLRTWDEYNDLLDALDASQQDEKPKTIDEATASVGANHINLIMRLCAALVNECERTSPYGTDPMSYEAYREAIGLYPNEDIPLKGP